VRTAADAPFKPSRSERDRRGRHVSSQTRPTRRANIEAEPDPARPILPARRETVQFNTYT